MADLGSARARWQHQRLGAAAFEAGDDVLRQRDGVVGVAAIARWLAAARLTQIELNFAAGVAQQAHGRRADLGPELVDEAGDVERDLHGCTVSERPLAIDRCMASRASMSSAA